MYGGKHCICLALALVMILKDMSCLLMLQSSQCIKTKQLLLFHDIERLHLLIQTLETVTFTFTYTQDEVYIQQQSYSKAPVELEPKYGQIIHKTKSTYYNTATPRLQ